MALVVKNLPAKAGDIRDAGLIPGFVRSPAGGHGNPLQYSCLDSPRTEDPGRLQFTGVQNLTQLKWLSTAHVHIYKTRQYLPTPKPSLGGSMTFPGLRVLWLSVGPVNVLATHRHDHKIIMRKQSHSRLSFHCGKRQRAVVECWTWNTCESGPVLFLPEGLWANSLHGLRESGCDKRMWRPDLSPWRSLQLQQSGSVLIRWCQLDHINRQTDAMLLRSTET